MMPLNSTIHHPSSIRRRRSSSKTFSDLKFLCDFIEKQASAKGLDGKDRSTANVRLMYEAVEPMLYPPKKNGTVCTQNRWRTVVPYLREQKKKEMKKSGSTE